MEIQSAEQLVQDQCRPTAGQSGLYSEEQTLAQLACLEDWYLVAGGQKIRRDYTVKNFLAGLEFFDKVAILAEV